MEPNRVLGISGFKHGHSLLFARPRVAHQARLADPSGRNVTGITPVTQVIPQSL